MNTALHDNLSTPAKMLLFPTHDEEKLQSYLSDLNIHVSLVDVPESAKGWTTDSFLKSVPRDELNRSLSQILRNCGIPASLNGYAYIRESVLLIYDNPEYRQAITKSLYPTVAAHFHTSASRVERSIRHAIEVGWMRGNTDMLEHYFGYSMSPNSGKPTNSEFVATISEYLHLQHGSC